MAVIGKDVVNSDAAVRDEIIFVIKSQVAAFRQDDSVAPSHSPRQ